MTCCYKSKANLKQTADNPDVIRVIPDGKKVCATNEKIICSSHREQTLVKEKGLKNNIRSRWKDRKKSS